MCKPIHCIYTSTPYISFICICLYSAKLARGYGNLGYCYEMMKQYPQAIFCHNKVINDI